MNNSDINVQGLIDRSCGNKSIIIIVLHGKKNTQVYDSSHYIIDIETHKQ